MPQILVLILILGLNLAGCKAVQNQRALGESALDTELSDTRLPGSPPEAGPGTPQEGFDQELLEAQNP